MSAVYIQQNLDLEVTTLEPFWLNNAELTIPEASLWGIGKFSFGSLWLH
jgi:hypothetical protein